MIHDSLSSAATYADMPDWLGRALRFLSSPEAALLPEGRHDIDGDRLFALVQEYAPRPLAQCRWEAHRRHIDVQYVARGSEQIGVAPVSSLNSVEPYDDVRDVAFYEGGGDFITLRPGMFAVLFPHDAHCPCIRIGEGIGVVRKIVIKARVD